MKLFKSILVTASVLALTANCGALFAKPASASKIEQAKFYQSPGKPSAPIQMDYKLLTDNPSPGDEVKIEVSFHSPKQKMISAKLNNAGKMNLLTSKSDLQFSAAKPGTTEAKSFSLMAESEGVYFVSFSASIELNGRQANKVFTVPVKVGNGKIKLKHTGVVKTNSTGQRIIVHQGEAN